MKFNLRKKSGVNGTEIKVSVLFSPEETDHGLCIVNQDPNVRLDKLRIAGDDGQQADHVLMLLRILCSDAGLWELSKTNRELARHINHGVVRKEAIAYEAGKRKNRKRRKR
ncbi:hypothetical protein [Pseudomonas phage PMBT14]|uniref:Uncharacterized protein n=1 Tax=Pseudomonas phage PMBT14 TaxID=2059855 RepID=A0A2I6PI92_9CAUD|nr:hypothetical protein HWB42_gp37 [Pseudomonas phage PMBT14]AUM59754.1 hypothetical protein [Pseudomonas phage PMBT14]